MERLQTKVSSAVFTTWFQGTSALSFQDGVFVVAVPTTFAKAHLEGRFLEPLCSILADVTGTKVDLQFVVTKQPPVPDQQPPKEMEAHPPKRSYRIGKGRLTAALREKRLTEIAATAMNSVASVIPQTRAYRSAKHSDLSLREPSPDEYLTDAQPFPEGSISF